jgi:pimeloyl-ACP methyl ester carboxylesterase
MAQVAKPHCSRHFYPVTRNAKKPRRVLRPPDQVTRIRFRANGLVLNCLDYGGEGKPPMLFIHGGSAHAHWWDFIAPAFIDEHHVLALDQRGHGESEWAEEWAYGSRHYVADLEEIIASWKFGAPVLIGHSMGAHNVLAYAARNSERLRAIVAIDPPPDYTERAVEFLRAYAEKPPRRFESHDEAVRSFKVLPRETLAKKEVLEHVARRTYRRSEDGSWTHKIDRRTMIREPLEVWSELPQIGCPALIVKLVKSPLLEIEAAHKMVAMLPQGRLAQIDDSYHHVMFDNPEALIDTLDAFLSEIE